jgi:hypothetical protein
MSLLTDDEKAMLVIENLGPAALAGDKMSIYDCFHIALDVAERAVLAKLGGAELPEPWGRMDARGRLLADNDASGDPLYTADQLRQAFAQGAASQLASEPTAWYDDEIDCAYTRTELDGGAEEGLLPLYTRKESK